jgi:hypothetical protein
MDYLYSMKKFLSPLMLLTLLTAMFTATVSAAPRPLTPPPPSACSQTSETDDLATGFHNDTIDHVNISVSLDGLFDVNTGQLCSLRSRQDDTYNISTGSYVGNETGYLCLATAASGCSAIAGSSQSWNTALTYLNIEEFDAPWKGVATSQCILGKKFYAVAHLAHDTVSTSSWC